MDVEFHEMPFRHQDILEEHTCYNYFKCELIMVRLESKKKKKQAWIWAKGKALSEM